MNTYIDWLIDTGRIWTPESVHVYTINEAILIKSEGIKKENLTHWHYI